MMEAGENGFMSIRTETQPKKVERGWLTLETPNGDEKIECDVIVARLGSVAPRGFVESMGIEFTGPDREAFPKLSPTFESTVPGIFVIGALARSEERRVGKEGVSRCRSRWSPSH